MKKMNKSIKFLSMAFSIALVSVFISCGDDDDPIIIDEDPVVADGFYVLGSATAEEPDADLELALYSVNQTGGVVDMRDGFYGNYFYLNAGTLNFAFYTNNTPTIYGGSVEEVPFEGNGDFNYWKGALTEDGTAVTISEAGFYQVHVDLSSSLFFVSPVEYFEIIGSATPDAWSSGQEMPIKAGASLDKTEFEITDVVLRAGAGNFFKFRYNSNWTNNVTLADESVLPLQTNFGIDGFAGGVDIPFEEEDGRYTVTLTFTPGEISWVMTRTGDAEPLPEYPEAMYVIGAGTTYGWPVSDPAENANAVMHKLAGGHDGVFWKILHLTAASGFKLSAAGWGSPNLGFSNITEYDSEGLTVSDVDGNMTVSESGIYIVVLDLRNDAIKLSIKEAKVYGIGDAFPTDPAWTAGAASNLFTNDVAAKTVTSPALGADGNIRMYAQHSWIPDWWNAEFRVSEGVIDYRNDGGDQEGVAGTAGQVVTLSFDTNTGTIE